MKQRMTHEKVRKRARDLDLQAEVERVLALAEVDLGLLQVTDDKNTKTIPYAFTAGRKTRTIFRLGFDSEEKDEKLAKLVVCFPFWARKRNGPWTHGLETLQEELLESLAQFRTDKGGAQEDMRLALAKSNTDAIIAAIRTIYNEVSENLQHEPAQKPWPISAPPLLRQGEEGEIE